MPQRKDLLVILERGDVSRHRTDGNQPGYRASKRLWQGFHQEMKVALDTDQPRRRQEARIKPRDMKVIPVSEPVSQAFL